MNYRCPACGADSMQVFYTLDAIPVHSVRLLWTKDEALELQKGKMDLSHCPACGFICNISYDPGLQDYSAEYESTQAFSPTFNSFAYQLAQHLIDRYDLHNKHIIEIGCGQGEFISLLCELGNNQGTGFDPAYDPARAAPRSVLSGDGRVEIVRDYYSEKYMGVKADFVCCKMTLEHIRDVADFIGIIRRSIGDQRGATVFLQVPDVNRVLEEFAFWDIYYEHCSYFSMGSIARLFRSQGFTVRDLWRGYNDQYLMIDAQPADGPTRSALPQENDLEYIARDVKQFANRVPGLIDHWKRAVKDAYQQGQKVILWGAGSKGVAFLTTLGLYDEIEYAVDINPNKQDHTYMAGTGQKIVSPDFLQEYRPDLIILMNPIYRREVQAVLTSRGLSPRLISVGESLELA